MISLKNKNKKFWFACFQCFLLELCYLTVTYCHRILRILSQYFIVKLMFEQITPYLNYIIGLISHYQFQTLSMNNHWMKKRNKKRLSCFGKDC